MAGKCRWGGAVTVTELGTGFKHRGAPGNAWGSGMAQLTLPCPRVCRDEGGAQLWLAGNSSTENSSSPTLSSTGGTTNPSGFTSTWTIYKNSTERSFKRWRHYVAHSGHKEQCELQPAKIWEKLVIFWGNSISIHSTQKQLARKILIPAFHQRNSKKSYYFCLAYSCNLWGKRQPIPISYLAGTL